jgi:glycine cleavage system protein P-like pyridoxal-binding family
MAKKSKAEIAANTRAAVDAGMSEPKKPVSYKQAKMIGRKGLTFAKANAIINAMKKARVLNEHMGMTTTAAQKKKAKTILDQHM